MRVSKLALAEIAQRLGLPGAFGAVLTTLALVFFFSAVMPAQRQLERGRRDVLQLNEQQRRIQAGLERKPETAADQLKVFYGMFPPEPAAAESLQKIYDAAAQNQITLPHGEYALADDPKADLLRYRITLPVRGTYEQVRAFIATALEAVPALALDDVDFQRQRVGETQVEGKVRMTLFLSRK